MKRICFAAVLLVVGSVAAGSQAQAGESYSFKIGGKNVTVAAPRNCRSLSCLSVSAPDNAQPAAPIAPAQPSPPQPVVTQPVAPVVVSPAPAIVSTTAPAPVLAAPPPLAVPAAKPAQVALPSPAITESSGPALTLPTAPLPPPVRDADERPRPTIVTATHNSDDDADSPRGDWHSAGNKGVVRIKDCGASLCGYMLDADGRVTRETVLIDMKEKGGDAWSGSIKSRDSGDSYYAKMTLKRGDTLRVEACVLWHFFCSGNDWSRVSTSRQWMSSPRTMASRF